MESLHTHQCGKANCKCQIEGKEGMLCELTGTDLGPIEQQYAIASKQHGAR